MRLIFGLLGFVAGWLLRAPPIQTAEPDIPTPADQEFGSQLERAAELGALLDLLAQEMSAASAGTTALRDSVTALDKQLGRVGREQFKVNVLNETQQQQVQTALDQLRDVNLRREADLTLLRDQLRAEQSAQRLLVIHRILPALDSLDEAIASGERLGARQPAPHSLPAPALTLQHRVAIALGRGEIPVALSKDTAEWHKALMAWLAGLVLVRERLLQALAAEGVYPIAARGEPFDPHRHIAVEVIPATDAQPAGTIVDEYRRGYQVGERILRAAEVSVAKEVSL